jgi:PAS domain-containing protein
MAHVDLALSDLTDAGRVLGVSGSLDLWAYPVSMANEPCLLVDTAGELVAASPACAMLLGIDPQTAVGRPLVGDVLHLLDFGAIVSDLPAWEADKIPPRLAATTGGLARGLMRVRGPDGTPITVDVVSVPLRDNTPSSPVVGSLSFCALVR